MRCHVVKQTRPEPSDKALVAAMAHGDENALRELNQRYGRALIALATRVLANGADAEEVAVDALWQAWRQAGGFDPGRGSVGAWLVTLVRSRAIDRLRSRNAYERGANAYELNFEERSW